MANNDNNTGSRVRACVIFTDRRVSSSCCSVRHTRVEPREGSRKRYNAERASATLSRPLARLPACLPARPMARSSSFSFQRAQSRESSAFLPGARAAQEEWANT